MLETKTIIPLYNSGSGNGEVSKLIKKHLGDIVENSVFQVEPALDVVGMNREDLVRICAQRGEKIVPIYGGDGTQSRTLSLIYKLVEAGQIDPINLIIILIGNPLSGGERVLAKILGTDGVSLAQVLQQLQSGQFERRWLRPQSLEDSQGESNPLWWMYGTSGGVLTKMLSHVEEHRAAGVKSHSWRALKSLIEVWQSFVYQNERVRAGIGNEQIAAEELAYLVPPFVALSKFHFPSPPSGGSLLLYLKKGEAQKLEFYTQALFSLFSLAVLGVTQGSVLQARVVEDRETVLVDNGQLNGPQIVDSELMNLGRQVLINRSPLSLIPIVRRSR